MLQTTFLWYLVQIGHYQSLSIAAEKLHVSQPALSAGIKKLEKQLGVKLLNRTYKGVSLTEEGERVITLAEKAFTYLEEIETVFLPQEDSDLSLDDLVIYSNPAYSPVLMSALSSEYNTKKHVLQFFDLTPELNVQQLIQNNSNVVVLGIISDTHEIPPNIAITILNTSKAYIMCSQNFPYIAPDKTTISFKELVNIPMAFSKISFDFQNILFDNIKRYGKPNIKVFSPSSATILSAIQNGIAAGFSNRFFYSQDQESLRYLPVRNSPKFSLALVTDQRTDKEKIAIIADILKKFLL